MTLSDDLLTFIKRDLLRNEGVKLTAEDSLIERGLVDSIGLIQLISFVETHVGIRIPDHQVTPNNFETVQAIVDLVERTRGESK